MTRSLDPELRDLVRDAAEWRLLAMLFECPSESWRAGLAALAQEVDDENLREAANIAIREADPRIYHSLFGPGGPAPPREVSYRPTIHPGRPLAEMISCYNAFAYPPGTEETPDHVATQTGFVAYLRLKEAYARSRGNGDQAAVCRGAANHFLENNLSILAQPFARCLEHSPSEYLALASAALLQRVGPPRVGPSANLNVEDVVQCGSFCGTAANCFEEPERP